MPAAGPQWIDWHLNLEPLKRVKSSRRGGYSSQAPEPKQQKPAPGAEFQTQFNSIDFNSIDFSPMTEVLTEVTVDRLRKLDMVQHCKWIAYGTDGLQGKGCTCMRRSCTCLFLVTLSESLVSS
jgi:hypothetical protein